MPIEAPLEELGLFELFQLIALADKHGVLELRDNETGKNYTLYFEDGILTYIDLTSRIKEELKKRNVKDKKAYKIRGVQLFEYILEEKIMSQGAFKTLYKQIAEEMVYSLFAIESGSFSFIEKDFESPEDINLNMNVQNIIMEAARRMDEITEMEKVLPSRDIILEVSSDIQDKESIDLDRMEWKLLMLIDGKKTINDLINEVGDEFSVVKSLYGMVMAGIVTEKRIKVNEIKNKKTEKNELKENLEETENLWKNKQYKKGISLLNSLKEKYPREQRVVYELGYFYLKEGKFKEAISEWNIYILLSDEEEKKQEIKENLELAEELNKRIQIRRFSDES